MADRQGSPSALALVVHEAEAHARGFPGRGADDRQAVGPGAVHPLSIDQAGPGNDRGRRGDLPAVEPLEPAGQLRRAQGPARGDGPVPDDRWTGPPRSLHETSFELEPVGRLPHPYSPQHFRGNRFLIVVRDLDPEHAALATAQLQAVASDGLPNYFDDQRFGSVGFSGQFIGHAWLKGDHERALRLALAEPNPFDRSGERLRRPSFASSGADGPRPRPGSSAHRRGAS